MFNSLDISSSGLIAQRTRMDVIAANLANRYTTHDASGNFAPYRRRIVTFAPGDPASGTDMGVHVSGIELDQNPFRRVLEPGNPDADKDGYVSYPNINPSIEMVNALEASRAYEANITAAEATKSMVNESLRLMA